MIDLFENKWMKISFLDNWCKRYKLDQTRIYSLNTNNYVIIDKIFNKLHTQDCMNWTTKFTSFFFSCFIIWHTLLNNMQKDCVIIDIKALNKINISDVYSMSLQTNILVTVQRVKFIFIVDCSAYFLSMMNKIWTSALIDNSFH